MVKRSCMKRYHDFEPLVSSVETSPSTLYDFTWLDCLFSALRVYRRWSRNETLKFRVSIRKTLLLVKILSPKPTFAYRFKSIPKPKPSILTLLPSISKSLTSTNWPKGIPHPSPTQNFFFLPRSHSSHHNLLRLSRLPSHPGHLAILSARSTVARMRCSPTVYTSQVCT